MSRQVYEQLTLFPEVSPANHFQSQESMEGKTMTAISGLKCLGSSESCTPVGLLERMCLGSSIWRSTRCSLRWKKQVTKQGHLLYRLAVSTPGTNENGSVLWPTPTTGAALCSGTGSFRQLMKLKEKGLITEEERRNLSQGNGGRTNPEWLEWMQGFDMTWTGLIPTPIRSTYKGAPNARYVGGPEYRHALHELVETSPAGIIGKLSPMWTEWLMGYPIGQTELNASETQ